MPSSASKSATTTSSHSGPAMSRPQTQTAKPVATTAWRDAMPEGQGVADQEVDLAERHGQQPLQGAGGPLAQGRHAGHEEHDDEGEDAEQRRADPVEHVTGVP